MAAGREAKKSVCTFSFPIVWHVKSTASLVVMALAIDQLTDDKVARIDADAVGL